jgi:hypothetical protein
MTGMRLAFGELGSLRVSLANMQAGSKEHCLKGWLASKKIDALASIGRMLKTDAWQLEKECWRIAKYMEILDSMDVFCNLLSTKWMSERNNVLHGHT